MTTKRDYSAGIRITQMQKRKGKSSLGITTHWWTLEAP